jgi:hypothetical protein
MQYAEIGSFFATDLPRRDAWNRATDISQKFNPDSMTLNDLGIVIGAGTIFSAVVREGHHRLSRLLQVFGPQQLVAYNPVVKNPDDMDRDVEINAQCGVATISDFLALCLLQNFIGDE